MSHRARRGAQIRVAGVLGTANAGTLPYASFPDDQRHLKVAMRSRLFKLFAAEVFVLCCSSFGILLYAPRMKSECPSNGCSLISFPSRRTPLRHAMLHYPSVHKHSLYLALSLTDLELDTVLVRSSDAHGLCHLLSGQIQRLLRLHQGLKSLLGHLELCL